jgi:hypothetical protein
MLFQDTTAKTIEMTRSKKKVSRQSSLWRFSNCARRSEIAERCGLLDEEFVAVPGACLSFSDMTLRQTRVPRSH